MSCHVQSTVGSKNAPPSALQAELMGKTLNNMGEAYRIQVRAQAGHLFHHSAASAARRDKTRKRTSQSKREPPLLGFTLEYPKPRWRNHKRHSDGIIRNCSHLVFNNLNKPASVVESVVALPRVQT